MNSLVHDSQGRLKAAPTFEVEAAAAFERVKTLGLALPGVEAATRYDGSPVLKLGGAFMAGMTTHASAEPGSLVVRMSVEEREWLVMEAPETYYISDYHQKHPVVLVRLSRIDRDALRDLLSIAWRLTLQKVRPAKAGHYVRAATRVTGRGDAHSPSSSTTAGSIPAGNTRGRRKPGSRARP
jgi:hypothetical protein